MSTMTETKPEQKLRTYRVLIEREIQGWVDIEAPDAEAAKARIFESMVIPNQRERRSARAIYQADPITDRAGRRLVLKNKRIYGTAGFPDQERLTLDCGHDIYIDADLWFPKNPYADCPTCERMAAKR